MESFDALVKELNETENKYQILHEQYKELKNIVLPENEVGRFETVNSNEESCFSRKISKITKNETRTKNKSTIKIDEEQKSHFVRASSKEPEGVDYKKLVKNRIKNFHTTMANISNFKATNKEKNKFINNLAQSNEEILSKEKNVPSVQKFLDGFHK